jgi:zinc-ribbon domain
MDESRKNRSRSSDAALVCPSCGREHGPGERFCASCGMPLVFAGAEESPVTPAQERARKIDPRYAQGETVKVAFARNQAESDLVQNILLEEGIPSIARRSRGFDVPDFLAAGPRDVLVPESGAELARGLLREADVAETVEPSQPPAIQARIVLAVLGGGLLAALIAWLLANGSPS